MHLPPRGLTRGEIICSCRCFGYPDMQYPEVHGRQCPTSAGTSTLIYRFKRSRRQLPPPSSPRQPEPRSERQQPRLWQVPWQLGQPQSRPEPSRLRLRWQRPRQQLGLSQPWPSPQRLREPQPEPPPQLEPLRWWWHLFAATALELGRRDRSWGF